MVEGSAYFSRAGRSERSSRRKRALTLIELLAVVSVIGIMVGVGLPLVAQSLRSSDLKQSGDTVRNLIATARQTALSKNTMTAVVLLGNAGQAEDFRAFTVLEYQPKVGWTQHGGWEILRPGVVVDFPADACTFVSRADSVLPLVDPEQEHSEILFRGHELPASGGFAARVFLPSGALWNAETPARIRLVDGYREGESVRARRGRDGNASNYYDLTILGATGLTKVNQP